MYLQKILDLFIGSTPKGNIMKKLKNEYKEIIELSNNHYYFDQDISDVLNRLFYKITSLENNLIRDTELKDLVFKNNPNVIMFFNNFKNLCIDNKAYYKYNPNIYFSNLNPKFEDLEELNHCFQLELQYNFFLYIHGYYDRKNKNIKLLQNIISHYKKRNKLSDLEKVNYCL